jgi:hypothetical protein
MCGDKTIHQSNAVSVSGGRVEFDDGGWNPAEDCFFSEEQCRTYHGLPLLPQGIESVVCNDIAERQRIGIQNYGKTVSNTPLSLREWLVHAYQECLDQAIYLRRAIDEIDQVAAAPMTESKKDQING